MMHYPVTVTSALFDELNLTIGIKAVVAEKGCGSNSAKKTPRIAEKDDVNSDYSIDLWDKADLTWSDEAPLLKRKYGDTTRKPTKSSTASENSEPVPLKQIARILKTLRLHGKKISIIDKELEQLLNLKELSLSGNHVQDIRHIPRQLEVLHLNANCFRTCPDLSHMPQLAHLGLAYNQISTLVSVITHNGQSNKLEETQSIPPIITWLPSSIKSLDLSFNNLTDLQESILLLSSLPNLAILSLMGNPLSLLGFYRPYIVSRLMRLKALDDAFISEGEKANAASQTFDPEKLTQISLAFKTTQLQGLAITQSSPSENPDQPPDEHSYFIQFMLNGCIHEPVTSQNVSWVEGPIPLDFSKTLHFDVSSQIRDSLKGNAVIALFRKTTSYICKVNEAEDGTASEVGVGVNQKAPNANGTGATPGAAKGTIKPAPAKKVDKGKPIAKGKKGKEENVNQWTPFTAATELVGFTTISLSPILDGKGEINGSFQLLKPNSNEIQLQVESRPTSAFMRNLESEKPINVIGSIDLGLHLNPDMTP